MDWSRCFCGMRWPGNGLNMRAGTGTVPLFHTPCSVLGTWLALHVYLGEVGPEGGSGVTIRPPTKEKSLLEKRFAEGETESRGVIWRKKAQLGLERLGLK